MTDPSKEEQRALSRDELDLVSAARQPELREMSDRDLSDLVTRLRDRRDRARGLAERQQREMRGKAPPAGASPAADNAGTRSKEHFLGAALARAMEERERRGSEESMSDDESKTGESKAGEGKAGEGKGEAGKGDDQHAIAEKALEMRREADKHAPEHPENTPTPDEGMHSVPNEGAVPSGNFDAEGHRVVVERSRKVR
jgi:uncharacterized low-complexity protein